MPSALSKWYCRESGNGVDDDVNEWVLGEHVGRGHFVRTQGTAELLEFMSEESRCFAPQQPNRRGAEGNGNGRIHGRGRNEMVQWGRGHLDFTRCGAERERY